MENKPLLYSKNYVIRWDDMDAFNHVNNAAYFTYLQECRFDWLLSHNIIIDPTTFGPIVGEVGCKYLKPITYPAEIVVELYLNHKAGRRIYLEHIIRDKNTPELIYATATATVIWIDFTTGRSIMPPPQYDYILEDISAPHKESK